MAYDIKFGVGLSRGRCCGAVPQGHIYVINSHLHEIPSTFTAPRDAGGQFSSICSTETAKTS